MLKLCTLLVWGAHSGPKTLNQSLHSVVLVGKGNSENVSLKVPGREQEGNYMSQNMTGLIYQLKPLPSLPPSVSKTVEPLHNRQHWESTSCPL